jgi:hypothetical protein
LVASFYSLRQNLYISMVIIIIRLLSLWMKSAPCPLPIRPSVNPSVVRPLTLVARLHSLMQILFMLGDYDPYVEHLLACRKMGQCDYYLRRIRPKIGKFGHFLSLWWHVSTDWGRCYSCRVIMTPFDNIYLHTEKWVTVTYNKGEK